MHYFYAIIIGLSWCIVLPLQGFGAILFEDTFDDGDALGWAPYADTTFKWDNNAFKGTGAGNNQIYASVHSSNFGNMTYAATLIRRGGDAGSFGGLALRIQPDGTQYLFGISSYRNYWFARVINGSVEVLASWTKHSLLDAITNTLQISCEDSIFRFYANGYYLGRINDASIADGGGVGVFVQHDAQFVFDDISVVDTPLNTEAILPFRDTFDGAALDGWFMHGGDVFSVAGGNLHGVGAGNGYLYRCYVSGAFEDFTVVTTLSRIEGYAGYPVGITLKGLDDAYHSGYIFAVNGRQEFMFSRADGDTMYEVSGWQTNSVINNTQNTLKVTCKNSTFTLEINELVVGTYWDSTYKAGAVGVLVSDSVQATFDSIAIYGADGVVALQDYNVIRVTAKPHLLSAHGLTIYSKLLTNEVNIYNATGKLVQVLKIHKGICVWDGCNFGGNEQSRGIYYLKDTNGEMLKIIKLH